MESQFPQPLGGFQTSTRRLQTTHNPTHPGFYTRKQQILNSLVDFRSDRNSKGHNSSIDEPILPLIEILNKHEDYVTVSSCSGRISIYSISNNDDDFGIEELSDDSSTIKFGAGKLLFITHSQIDLPKKKDDEIVKEFLINKIFGIESDDLIFSTADIKDNFDLLQTNEYRLVYFKFEPMVESRTLDSAKNLINLTFESGYRESGLLTNSKRHLVTIRNSQKIDAPIGYINLKTQKLHIFADLSYILLLGTLSNQKFEENSRKINELITALDEHLFGDFGSGDDGIKKIIKDGGKTSEHKEERRERKRRDGLARQIGLRKSGTLSDGNDGDVSTVDDESQGLDNVL
ncbi:7883_t:CDS:2 [Diversispora eburnea]|uniref:tRNA(Phe) 7-[(3-amino-3-carboxypropyl)-4-demethylwyosine(37)-N(4)]-methyltransferase n=1 Tax=Diversispora eburnea TaxID=1213867 RepID=A0A9N8WNY2_9GLOM|nr:7883_t:CDS:2 [Diversispora eburnea]